MVPTLEIGPLFLLFKVVVMLEAMLIVSSQLQTCWSDECSASKYSLISTNSCLLSTMLSPLQPWSSVILNKGERGMSEPGSRLSLSFSPRPRMTRLQAEPEPHCYYYRICLMDGVQTCQRSLLCYRLHFPKCTSGGIWARFVPGPPEQVHLSPDLANDLND